MNYNVWYSIKAYNGGDIRLSTPITLTSIDYILTNVINHRQAVIRELKFDVAVISSDNYNGMDDVQLKCMASSITLKAQALSEMSNSDRVIFHAKEV